MTAHNLHDVAFPTLTPEQMADLARCGHATLTRYEAGQTLYRACDRDFRFFVVEAGEIEVVDSSGDTPNIIAVHGPGQFTGEIAQITGSPSLVTGVARTECTVYAIENRSLRQILNACPAMSDILLQAFIARRQLLQESGTFTGLRVIGSRYSQDTFRIRDFLARNRVPFTWLDLEGDPDVAKVLERFGLGPADTPVVAWGQQLLLRNPSTKELAEAIGIRRPLEGKMYDLLVVGAGPAGLAAAVYGASEGLTTAVLERTAPGGQAESSMRIENYLGFPAGLTGAELADRAVVQADKFGAQLTTPAPIVGLTFEQGYPIVHLEGGETVAGKCLLIATGAQYRRLDVDGCTRFEGCGVYYAATPNEAQLCQGADVVVVGGGNSAGQAVVYLAHQCHKVFLVVRGDSLLKSMSTYLAVRITQTPNVEVLLDTRIERMIGDQSLRAVEIANGKTGERRTLEIAALFSFIGADPHTDWLPADIATDAKGFVCTGATPTRPPSWDKKRAPFLLETSRPGVFAAGDVRAGSIKRVASAVGEGAMAVKFVHEVLKER